MATTTVHIPDHLLKRIDDAARGRGVSRNRFVVSALEEALVREAGEWPAGFFESALGPEDRETLKQAAAEMEAAILGNRQNRSGSPL